MITLASQQYCTAETEIMTEGATHSGSEKRERGVLNVNTTHIEKAQQ